MAPTNTARGPWNLPRSTGMMLWRRPFRGVHIGGWLIAAVSIPGRLDFYRPDSRTGNGPGDHLTFEYPRDLPQRLGLGG